MANYFQTDDRDDYFASFEKKKNPTQGETTYTLKLNGEIVFEGISVECRSWSKKVLGLTKRYVKFGKWKELLKENGYEVVVNIWKLRNLEQPITDQQIWYKDFEYKRKLGWYEGADIVRDSHGHTTLFSDWMPVL